MFYTIYLNKLLGKVIIITIKRKKEDSLEKNVHLFLFIFFKRKFHSRSSISHDFLFLTISEVISEVTLYLISFNDWI